MLDLLNKELDHIVEEKLQKDFVNAAGESYSSFILSSAQESRCLIEVCFGRVSVPKVTSIFLFDSGEIEETFSNIEILS